MKKLNQWLILLANLGVVAGLALVAYEIHQANQLAETRAHIHRLSQMQEARRVISESEHLPGIFLKLEEHGLESLSTMERFRLRSWEAGVMLRMQSHYHQYLQGYLDQETADQVLTDAAIALKRWQALGIVIEDEHFRQRVEEAAKK